MTADLRALFDPASVAIVGASDDPAKWGYALARQALRAGDRRPVELVNRRGGTILGRPAATSLTSGELVVLCVPLASFETAVDEALAAGARIIVAITAGFAELGADGAARQRAVIERVRAAGARLVGPNCLGVVDNTTELYLSSDPFTPGGIALLSQSGNLSLELELRFRDQSLGFSRFASFGNQADVTVVDLIRSCVAHEGTRAIAIYVEDFGDGRAFVDAATEAARVGKPVVLLTAGASEASARGARSHTGALTSEADVVSAAALGAGIHQARTPRELVTMLAALVSPRRARTTRTAVLADGGGHGALAADTATRAGLSVPELGAATQHVLRDRLWAQSAVSNPVDLAGKGEQDPLSYATALDALLADDGVDAVLMTGYFGGYGATETSFGGPAQVAGEQAAGAEIIRLVGAAGKPVAMQSMYPGAPTSRALAEAGVPVFGAVEDAALALRVAVRVDVPTPPCAVPPAAQPVTDVGYFAVRRLLAAGGVAMPPARPVSTLEEVRAAAPECPGPYALKAVHQLHKTEAGGVALGLVDETALVDAYQAMHARLGAGAYSVESMAPDGIELIVGVRWDPRFGPVVLVGLGGIHTELTRDVAFALAPVSPDGAAGLLRGLRGAALLDGFRGAPAVSIEAAAHAIAAISRVGAEHPELAELEVNPLRVTPDAALALDARAIATASTPG